MPTDRCKAHWKKVLFAWLGSLAILALLFLKTDIRLRHVLALVLLMDPLWLLLVFGLSAAFHVLLGALKWFLILRGIGCDTTFGETLFVRMGSDPVRFALPFKTGELSNILYYSRLGKLPLAESASWVIFDKALNMFGTLSWFGVGALIAGGVPGGIQNSMLAAGAALVALLVAPPLRAWCVSLAGAVHGKLGRVARALLVTFERIGPPRRVALLALAAVFQLRPLIVCYMLFFAFVKPVFTSTPTVPEVLVKGSVAVLASNVPGTAYGIGPREAALVAQFKTHLPVPPKVPAARPAPEEEDRDAETSPFDEPAAPAPIAAPAVRKDPAATQPGLGGSELVGPGAPLVAIGILMAVSIHLVPAVLGLPLMAGLLTAIEEGRRPLREAEAALAPDEDAPAGPPDDLAEDPPKGVSG